MLKTPIIKPALPSATDIYDLDTEQLHQTLHKVKAFLKSNPVTEENTPEDQDWMEKAMYLRELIETEIDERKSVESFGNMCMNYRPDDNPFEFLRRFDQFNRQLQKLVQEAEHAKTTSTIQSDKTPVVLPAIHQHSTLSQQSKQQDLAKSTHSHFTQSEKSVKMGLGNKKRKSQANDMMKMLDKLRVNKDNKVMIGKSTQVKEVKEVREVKGQQKATTNVQENRSVEGKKPVVVTRNSQNKGNAEGERRKEEAMKTLQKTAVANKQQHKEKIPTHKDLIAMVRLEQEEKRNKANKVKQKAFSSVQSTKSQLEAASVPQQLNHFQPRSLKQLSEPEVHTDGPISQTQQTLIVEKIVTSEDQSKSSTSCKSGTKPITKSMEKINMHKDLKRSEEIPIKEEEFEESIEKMPATVQSVDKISEKIMEKPIVSAMKTQKSSIKAEPSIESLPKQPNTMPQQPSQAIKSATALQNPATQQQPSADQIVEDIRQQSDCQEQGTRKFQLKGRIIRTSTASSQKSKSSKNITKQQQRAQSAASYTLLDKSTFDKVEKRVEYNDDEEVDIGVERRPQQPNQEKTKEVKDCYSEDYWVRVKREAMENLEKLKKEREEREMEKLIVNDQVNKALAEMQEYKEQAAELLSKQEDNEVSEKGDRPETATEQGSPTDIPASKAQAPKKPSKPKPKKPKKQQKPNPIIPIPKPLPAHIQNYLQIYPSFNHLFSVYYLKPSSQAILDISIIMKQLYTIFSIHNQVLQSNNYRKPLFSPFDSCNTVYINEPRQLLMHAQTTNIDIKTMIARLSVFNENLHGRFDEEKETRHYRVVKSREEVYDIVTTTFLRVKGWRELPHGMNLRTSWNLFWTWARPELDLHKLLVFQKINHFPLNKNLSRKDLLYKNIELFRKQFRTGITFLPLTFNLPKQYSQFSAKFHQDQYSQAPEHNLWIVKPIGKSRGRGIKLINNIVDVTCTDNIVVQKYLKNPLLLDGYKFDMRIYVLVTHLHPVEAFVYREGFARLSTEKYSLELGSIGNAFIHLTNFAIQKNNREAVGSFEGGSKISLKVLQQKLTKMGISWPTIWEKVHDIIAKSLLACSVAMPRFPTAFQLFGYDIMIDSQLNCFLIQINSSPSLQRSYMIDQLIKQSLIDDIIELVDPVNFDRKECCEVFCERLARKGQSTQREDNIDIGRMVNWRRLRKVGEMPDRMGGFERVLPGGRWQDLEKAVEGRFNPNVRYLDN